MKKGIVTLLIITLVITLVGCNSNKPAQDTPKKTIVVGTSADFPPFENHEVIDGKDVIVGFDIDLINEIGKELGAEIRIDDIGFDGLIAALQSDKIDLAIAGMSADEERKEKVNFSEPYYEASQTLLIKADAKDVASMDDVKGMLVGSQLGSTSDDVISEFKDIEVKKYNKVTDAVLDLKNGRLQAVIVEDSIAAVFAEKNAELKVIEPKGLNTEDVPFAIALAKDDEQLLKDVNAALQKIKESGKYDELIAKWFE